MRTVSDLLSTYQHVIDELRIHTASKGTFNVLVDGEMLFSKHEEGRHAEPGEVLARFEERFAEGVPRFE